MQRLPLLTFSVTALAVAALLLQAPLPDSHHRAPRATQKTRRGAPARATRLQPLFTLTDLGTLGGNSSEATAINHPGQVVGYSDTRDGHSRAFLWSAGRMKDLGALDGCDSCAYAINDRGDVVGGSHAWGTRPDYSHAVLWTGNGIHDLGVLPGCGYSEAYGINNRGQVVGASRPSPLDVGGAEDRAFLWRNGRMIDLNDAESRRLGVTLESASGVNDHGVIAGETMRTDTTRERSDWGFVRDAHHTGLLKDGSAILHSVQVNASGMVLACASASRFDDGEAVLWRDGLRSRVVRDDCGSGGAPEKHLPACLNVAGQVVGWACRTDNSLFPDGRASYAYLADHGILWDLNRVPIAGPRCFLTDAVAINDRGQIACNAVVGGDPRAVLLTPTMPLPQLLHELRLLRFREIDDLRLKTATIDKSKADQALELVVADVESQLQHDPQLTPAGLADAMKSFRDVAERQDDWNRGLTIATAAHGSLRAIAVTYGLISRVAVIDDSTGARFTVPAEVAWNYALVQRPFFFRDGTLAVVSSEIKLAGCSDTCDIAILARRRLSYRLTAALSRDDTIDWGGAQIHGDRLVVVSKDRPTVMFSCADCPEFPRKEVFVMHRGRLRRVASIEEQPERRFLDAWIARAEATSKADRLQRTYRRLAGGNMEASSFVVTARRGDREIVDYQDNEHPIQFVLRRRFGFHSTSVARGGSG